MFFFNPQFSVRRSLQIFFLKSHEVQKNFVRKSNFQVKAFENFVFKNCTNFALKKLRVLENIKNRISIKWSFRKISLAEILSKNKNIQAEGNYKTHGNIFKVIEKYFTTALFLVRWLIKIPTDMVKYGHKLNILCNLLTTDTRNGKYGNKYQISTADIAIWDLLEKVFRYLQLFQDICFYQRPIRLEF